MESDGSNMGIGMASDIPTATIISAPAVVPICKLGLEELKTLVNGISQLTDEANFKFRPAGLSLEVVDPAHVAMIKITAPMESFRDYNNTIDRDVGIDMDRLGDIVKLMKRNETIELEITGESPAGIPVLAYKIVMGDGTTVKTAGTIRTVDTLGMPAPKLPNVNLTTSFRVDPARLEGIFKACALMSDHVMISVVEGKITISAAGEYDKLESVISGPAEGEQNARSLFSLDMLQRIVKAAKGIGELKISMGTDYPLKVEYSRGVDMKYLVLLAPRIEND